MFLPRRPKFTKFRQKIMPPIDNGTGQACPNEIGAASLSFNRKEKSAERKCREFFAFFRFALLRRDKLRSLRLISFAVEVWALQSPALRNP